MLLELKTMKTLRIAMKTNKITMTHGQELTSESYVTMLDPLKESSFKEIEQVRSR